MGERVPGDEPQPRGTMGAMPRIEDYALIGDLQTAALVSREGAVEWCCLPRFDSGACFAALLGDARNGHWSLAPAGGVQRSTRRYRSGTLILETVVECDTGVVRIIDFMPPRDAAPDIVRIAEGLDGEVPMRSELVIRFDYGRIVPWVRRVENARLAVAGPDALCLRTPAATHGEGRSTVSEFTIRPGERMPFTLTWFPSHLPVPEVRDPERELDETEGFWRDWTSRSSHAGDHHDEIHESLLILKALTHLPTGGIVAAPTTSLPEAIGGSRNWDYRFCWLRDAALTLSAMLRAGYRDEARAWRDWLLRAAAGDPADLQIMYGVGGERRLDERELEWLPGFAGSAPVRVGNAAHGQLQLDVYGELMDAMYLALKAGVDGDSRSWELLRTLLEWLEDAWRRPDSGMWEVRGPERHFTSSKAMAWLAFDRGVRMVEEFGFDGPVHRWREHRDTIRAEVLERGWDASRGAFVQAYGAPDLDAGVLLLPLIGLLPADDPRMVSTVEAIRRELTVDGLVQRYVPRPDGAVDGIAEPEGVFLPCSFWLVSVLAMQGRHREARELFERLLDLRNDVGLLSEEYDPVAGRQLGNMPQAFTHLALVDAALALAGTRPLMKPGGG